MPAVVSEQGNGTWRHQVTNIIAEAGDAPDTATMMAYGLVTGWVSGGVPITFTDYTGRLRRVDGKKRSTRVPRTVAKSWKPPRSEEHTSELQSLMRISYAVFSLKKKKKISSNYNRE